jgi:uncharacterized membrane-anchored protein
MTSGKIMIHQKMILGLLCTSCLAAWPGLAADKTNSILNKLNFVKGPAKAVMGSVAEVQVPEGYLFSDSKGTRTLLQAMGNPTNGRELGFLAPTNMDWFIVFEFDNIGFVERRRQGQTGRRRHVEVDQRQARSKATSGAGKGAPSSMSWLGAAAKIQPGIQQPEWAIRAESQGEPIVNYNTRLLGRKGVMEVSLVVAPDKDVNVAGISGAHERLFIQAGERYPEV